MRRAGKPGPHGGAGAAGVRTAIIHHGEDGYWVAEIPSLPGCISQGVTRMDVIRNAREAIEAYAESLVADGLPVPAEKFHAMTVAVRAGRRAGCGRRGTAARMIA